GSTRGPAKTHQRLVAEGAGSAQRLACSKDSRLHAKGHVVDGWRDRRRVVQLGEALNLQLGQFIDKGEQPWRNFRAFSRQDVTKPVSDLIADRAAMRMVEQ
ncbi:MAG: hypothetical protein ABSG88_24990, partial [Bradyrhizobium sp.]